MWAGLCVSVFLILNIINEKLVNGQDEDYLDIETTTIGKLAEGEQKLSESIRKALDHFKQPNPEGLPGLDIPDPYFVPDIRKSLGFGNNLVFTETTLYGINKFRILYISTEIEDMECRAGLIVDKLQVCGKYTVNTWLNSYKGAFTANISGIIATAVATLGVERDGKLRSQNISLDITFKNIAVNFDNAGFLATLLSGVFNSMGNFLFESIKPVLLRDAYTNMREEIDKKLDQIIGDIQFPNTISPIDMVIIDARNRIRQMKMDPLKVDDYNITTSIINIKLTNTWLTGLSSLYRIGNISLYLENNTVIAVFSIGTQELKGSTCWNINAVGNFISRVGSTSFSIGFIQGKLVLAQPLDTRKRMELRDLEVELGNIQLSFDGAETLDYIIEFSANILPNLLRYQIIEVLINPMKWKIQQELNATNVEDLIINKLPEIDKIEAEGFQLSALKIFNITDNAYDDDEFFNF